MNKNLLDLDLQLFAETPPPVDPPKDDTDKDPVDPPIDKKYDDADVDEIVKGKLAKWKKEQDEAIKAAERRGKMTENERVIEEKKELEEKIAEFERKELVSESAKTIRTKLTEAELPIDDEIVSLIANSDETIASETLNIIMNYVSNIKKENNRQPKPDEGGKFTGKSEEDNVSLAERARQKRIIK